MTSGRARLGDLPRGTEALREVRYLSDDDLEDVSSDELAIAVRWLRAAAYSAQRGADRLEQTIRNRERPNP